MCKKEKNKTNYIFSFFIVIHLLELSNESKRKNILKLSLKSLGIMFFLEKAILRELTNRVFFIYLHNITLNHKEIFSLC